VKSTYCTDKLTYWIH